jgi:4-alpha-glucanotransferase
MWNELYLDLERVPELQTSVAARRLLRSEAFKERRQKLRRDPLVDYPAQMALKRQVLEIISRAFFAEDSVRRRTFEAFLEAEPRVTDYARFRAVQEQRKEPWTEWPARMRGGGLRDADCPLASRQYHLYVQWLAHEQMTQISRHALEQRVDLYLDMPLGTHCEGYDAWRYQQLFALEASGGAPPDPVFTQGQDWGFAPVHPEHSRKQGHEYIRSYLRHHLRHARMLRFDHVMGLHRLYWVPRGWPARLGAYVNYPAEEYYAMLSIESHRHQALIIGENLGTVPAAVNHSLKRHGIAGMFVVQYEARPAPRPALRPVPAQVVASLNTHDMPPFAAFWKGLDIEDRRKLGLIRRADLGRERKLRALTRQSLLRLSGVGGERKRREAGAVAVWRGMMKVLGASAARWVLLNLEDLWAETLSQNTPGTAAERVNWRRKVRLTMEALRCDESVLQTVRELARVRRSQRFAESTLGIRPIDVVPQGRQDVEAGADDPSAGRSRKQ